MSLGESEGFQIRRIVVADAKTLQPFERRLIFGFLVVSIFIHLVVLFVLQKQREAAKLSESIKIAEQLKLDSLKTDVLTIDQLDKIISQSSKSRNVVESAKSEAVLDKSKSASYLGERTQRVEKETRAKDFGNLAGSGKNSGLEKDSSQSTSKDIKKKIQESLPKLSQLGVGTWALPPVDDLQNNKNSLEKPKQNSGPAKGTHDYLGRDVALGSETLLNTDEYLYASFFNRLKAEVAPRWEPKISALIYDPQSRLRAGFFRSEVEFVMDRLGQVKSSRVLKSSGVEAFDEIAMSALMSLPQMNNLPTDLLESDGTYRLSLGFVVQVHQSNVSSEYVPDPRLLRRLNGGP